MTHVTKFAFNFGLRVVFISVAAACVTTMVPAAREILEHSAINGVLIFLTAFVLIDLMATLVIGMPRIELSKGPLGGSTVIYPQGVVATMVYYAFRMHYAECGINHRGALYLVEYEREYI